jgi:transposase
MPLKVSPAEEKILLTRLEAARQLYNACLGEALKRLNLLRQSRLYQRARQCQDKDGRRELFREARAKYGFKDSALQHYAVEIRRSWIGEHLDVHVAQNLATRAFQAVEKILLGKAHKVRFKGKNQMDTVEGKTNVNGIRWREGHVEWLGLSLPAIIDYQDPVIVHGLTSRVKYVRLVRRKINGRNRFYVQLICEGLPYIKDKNQLGKGVVGLDIGPSTIARVSQNEAHLDQFCAELADKEREIRRLQRKLDRQRRANNPNNYNPDGTVKKGKKKWVKSKRYLQTQARLAEIHRKLAAHRRSLQGRLVNSTLRMGDTFKLEKLSYKALQKLFGKSVNTRAPGRFVRELARKAESAGGTFVEFPTKSTKLSQTCHCGRVHKKRLSERWHECECGTTAQRDLYSAFLAMFVDQETYQLDAGRAKEAWPGADALLRAAFERAVKNQPASGRAIPASFGYRRSQSGSPAKAGATDRIVGRTEAEARDVVANPKGRGESVANPKGRGESAGEVAVAAGRTPRL